MTLIPSVPNGKEEIINFYGDPRRYLLPDGTLSPAYEKKYIVRVDLPAPLMLDLTPEAKEPMVSKITSHAKVADRILEALELVYEQGLWDALGGYSGGFVWRAQRGTTNKMSMHCFGAAWDFGASRNKLGDAPGGPDPDMPMEIVKIFKGLGFTWGGDWDRPDQMHFQWATGY